MPSFGLRDDPATFTSDARQRDADLHDTHVEVDVTPLERERLTGRSAASNSTIHKAWNRSCFATARNRDDCSAVIDCTFVSAASSSAAVTTSRFLSGTKAQLFRHCYRQMKMSVAADNRLPETVTPPKAHL